MEVDATNESNPASSVNENKVSSESSILDNLKSPVPSSSNDCDSNNLDDTLSINSADISVTEDTKSTVPDDVIEINDTEPLSVSFT